MRAPRFVTLLGIVTGLAAQVGCECDEPQADRPIVENSNEVRFEIEVRGGGDAMLAIDPWRYALTSPFALELGDARVEVCNLMDCRFQVYGVRLDVEPRGVARPGWHLERVLGCGEGRPFTMFVPRVGEEVGCRFEFLPDDPRELTVHAIGDGTVSANAAGETYQEWRAVFYDNDDPRHVHAWLPAGGAALVHATPGAGQGFVGWEGACAGQGLPATVQLDEDRTCSARFAPLTAVSVELEGDGEGIVNGGTLGCGTVCATQVAHGATITLVATPVGDSVFAGWSGDCAGAELETTVTVAGVTRCVATFVRTATLAVLVEGDGDVTSDGLTCPGECVATVRLGEPITLTARPAPGSTFAGWSGDCAGAKPMVTVTLGAPATCTATFARVLFRLTVAVTGPGDVDRAPAGAGCGPGCSEHAGGARVAMVARPASGANFTGWGGDCAGLKPEIEVVLDRDRVCSATFAEAVPPSRTLAVRVTGQGTVTSVPTAVACRDACSAAFPEGTRLSLTVTPDAGWEIAARTGDCGEIVLDADRACDVVFTELAVPPPVLAVTVAGAGRVTSDPAGVDCGDACGVAFALGTLVTLTARPDAGARFDRWSGDCAGTSPTVTFMMGADRACTATFALPTTRELSVTSVGPGQVTSNPAGISCGTACRGSFKDGTSVTLTAKPDADAVFVGWSDGCSGTGSTTKMAMSSARSCTATFAARHALVITKSGSGTVTSDPAGISCGATCQGRFAGAVQLTAVPAVGFTFKAWGGDCAGTSSTSTVTVAADRACTATFEPVVVGNCADFTVISDGQDFQVKVAHPPRDASYAWDWSWTPEDPDTVTSATSLVVHAPALGEHVVTLTVTSPGCNASSSLTIKLK